MHRGAQRNCNFLSLLFSVYLCVSVPLCLCASVSKQF